MPTQTQTDNRPTAAQLIAIRQHLEEMAPHAAEKYQPTFEKRGWSYHDIEGAPSVDRIVKTIDGLAFQLTRPDDFHPPSKYARSGRIVVRYHYCEPVGRYEVTINLNRTVSGYVDTD
jgi:hypothetical protein